MKRGAPLAILGPDSQIGANLNRMVGPEIIKSEQEQAWARSPPVLLQSAR